MRVGDAIRYRTAPVQSVDVGETTGTAARRMLDERVRSVVVTEDGRVRGMVTTTDVLRALLDSAGSASDRPIRDVIRSEPVTVHVDTPLTDALAMFSGHGINHLIVIDDEGRLAGVLTPADVSHRLTEHLSFLNEHLQHYIHGTPHVYASGERRGGAGGGGVSRPPLNEVR